MKRKIAIDLTWVRHKKVGGTESCIRNLLDGFSQIDCEDIEFVLLVAKDNAYSFDKYREFDCFKILVCDIKAANQGKRVLWQNFKMGKLLKSNNIHTCLEPIYGKPFLNFHGVDFYTTIHDLQAIHYPEYFSKLRVLWMKLSWKNAVRTSKKVIAISEYVKNDIIDKLKAEENKIVVIYDAIDLNQSECLDNSGLNKYGVEQGKYYYTVSSLLPHKNLKTIINVIGELKRRNSEAFYPLIISGVGGKDKSQLDEIIREQNIEDDIIFTSFVDNIERNMLYKNCKAFLFPSVFEGFGMPPIEAMIWGVPVIISASTSLREVTGGIANYVYNPLDYKEWVSKLEMNCKESNKDEVNKLISRYECKAIAEKYHELFIQF